jgi:ribosome maturation factor RimP
MADLTERLHVLVLEALDGLGVELYDLEYAGGSLRIALTKSGGIDLDSLTNATRAISRSLDENDPITAHYTLEVTSPGVERKLRTPAHWASAIGEQIRVKTKPSVEGERRRSGTVVAADAHSATIDDEGTTYVLAFEDVERATTHFDWGPAPKPGSGAGKGKPVPASAATTEQSEAS